jgi:ubiquinone/menaquinone biosynthesis C-methylase UbiE
MKILDVGCGDNKTKGAIGIDINPNTQADIIHDLNKIPWPFNDNEFDEIICNDVLEHLDDIFSVMEEIHRICKPNGIVKIRVPHFSSSTNYGDLTHRHLFSTKSFDGFSSESNMYYHYTKVKFKKIDCKIRFGKLYKILEWLVNTNPERYERYFAFIFPAGNIEFKFMVLK